MPCGEFKRSYLELMALLRWRIHRATLVATLPVVLAFPAIAGGNVYLLSVATLIMINATAIQGLNVILGLTGQISLAQGAMMAIGAYSFALLVKSYPIPWPVAMVLAALITSVVGIVFGSPAIRIKLFFVAISTLVLQFFVEFLISTPKYADVFGGSHGIHVRGIFPVEHHSLYSYYLALTVATLTTLAVANLARSSLGRAMKAVRDNDVAAQILGIDVPKVKLAAFGIGSFFIGLAGVVWGIWITQINPEQFTLDTTLDHYAMLIFGGLGRVWGPWLGAMTIVPLIEGLKLYLPAVYPAIGVYLSPLKLIILSAIIITLLAAEPRGVIETLRKAKEYFRLWPYAYERH
ncbi:MAG: branched-chain amino acid ABC transporter permease [Aigarchaeota archaeon]|nr:branched-chain amino acid ABC transporter permease [Aigarchaeota archaeon]MCS7126888.1 branched-chain amino acid ABC transporter permease [Candidatus Calditenuaceae archaeon]MCX8203046.1 branched-chain amino acid ABC transporter permease [Nitrososphaeria archaeon]MDW8043973.1 branched-chain amino acid ABC transporter permease [Nitrososphaerota archaeon]